MILLFYFFFFFFNDTATTEIYTRKDTLSLHDALPTSAGRTLASAPVRASSRWSATALSRAPNAPTWTAKARSRDGRAAADPFVALDGEASLAGAFAMAGGCVDCSSGRDARERSTSGPQTMSSATDTATAAPHTITAVRFHRGAGRCASDHRWLSRSGMKGRTSGCLSSASATADSTETGTARRRRIGTGGSVRCFWRMASRVAARNGGTPHSIS